MTETWLIYSTFPHKDEALSVGNALVEKHLAACANVHEITSIYRWEGKVQQAGEAVLLAKTRGEKREAAMALIKSLHSYELPCIVAYSIAAGLPEFLRWVAEETK